MGRLWNLPMWEAGTRAQVIWLHSFTCSTNICRASTRCQAPQQFATALPLISTPVTLISYFISVWDQSSSNSRGKSRGRTGRTRVAQWGSKSWLVYLEDTGAILQRQLQRAGSLSPPRPPVTGLVPFILSFAFSLFPSSKFISFYSTFHLSCADSQMQSWLFHQVRPFLYECKRAWAKQIRNVCGEVLTISSSAGEAKAQLLFKMATWSSIN